MSLEWREGELMVIEDLYILHKIKEMYTYTCKKMFVKTVSISSGLSTIWWKPTGMKPYKMIQYSDITQSSYIYFV